MKKRLFATIAAVLFVVGASFAQIEVKVNPIGLLFGGISASGEYILNDNMGVEASLRLASTTLVDVKTTGFGAGASYKYYFSPDKGADKFYVYGYLDYVGGKGTDSASATLTYSRVAAGFGAGYKWVADSGLLFDIGFGIGRNLSSNWTWSDGQTTSINFPLDLNGKLAIGWRF